MSKKLTEVVSFRMPTYIYEWIQTRAEDKRFEGNVSACMVNLMEYIVRKNPIKKDGEEQDE